MKHTPTKTAQQPRAAKKITRRQAERAVACAGTAPELEALAEKFQTGEMRNSHALKKLAHKTSAIGALAAAVSFAAE
jgi:hypothetical protein